MGVGEEQKRKEIMQAISPNIKFLQGQFVPKKVHFSLALPLFKVYDMYLSMFSTDFSRFFHSGKAKPFKFNINLSTKQVKKKVKNFCRVAAVS